MLTFAQSSDRELSSSLTWRRVAWLAFDVWLPRLTVAEVPIVKYVNRGVFAEAGRSVDITGRL